MTKSMEGKTEYDHINDKINLFLSGIVSRSGDQFDQSTWETYYGSVITHSSLTEPRRDLEQSNGRDTLTLFNYSPETGELRLNTDAEFPDEGTGAIVFDDGFAVVRTPWEDVYTAELTTLEHLTVAFLSERHLEAVRSVHPIAGGNRT